MIQVEQRTLRNLVRDAGVSWIVGPNGYKLMYCLGLMLDALLDAGWAGLKLRFAGLYSLDPLALSALGRERRLRQGLFEQLDPSSGLYSADGARRYAKRLRRWRQAWQHRGSPYELLRQLQAFHAPDQAYSYQVIFRSGRRYSVAGDRPEVTVDDVPTWNPDGFPAKWARYLVLIVNVPVYHTAPADIRARALQDLRGLVTEFNAAHCNGQIVVLRGSGTELWSELTPPPGDTGLPAPRAWSSAGTWSEQTAPEDAPIVLDFGVTV